MTLATISGRGDDGRGGDGWVEGGGDAPDSTVSHTSLDLHALPDSLVIDNDIFHGNRGLQKSQRCENKWWLLTFCLLGMFLCFLFTGWFVEGYYWTASLLASANLSHIRSTFAINRLLRPNKKSRIWFPMRRFHSLVDITESWSSPLRLRVFIQ